MSKTFSVTEVMKERRIFILTTHIHTFLSFRFNIVCVTFWRQRPRIILLRHSDKITQEISSPCKNSKTWLNRSKLVTGLTLRAPQSVCRGCADPHLYLPGHKACRSVAADLMEHVNSLSMLHSMQEDVSFHAVQLNSFVLS